ncbi:MAG TPA: hypothetical protein VGH15_02225 [Caulobacteraceae bacterium]
MPPRAEPPAFKSLRASEGSGRPLRNADFIAGLGCLLGRPIAKRAPGRKPKVVAEGKLDLLA